MRCAPQVFDEPTVLVCYRVTGEEEVPEGVVGVLTPDAPDVLSHLSVRARNMKVRIQPNWPGPHCTAKGAQVLTEAMSFMWMKHGLSCRISLTMGI